MEVRAMPFRESSPVEERIALMQAYDTGAFSVSELCRRFGISRQTFYVLKRRREGGDARWFEERSRAPKSVPHATPDEICAKVIAMRKRFPRFGPKKVRACLIADEPAVCWPAASTIGAILEAEGLVVPNKRRRRPLAQGEITAGSDTPNGEWAVDFKGWFRTRDGTRCDPLTVSDTASRYLIEVRITPPTHDGVKAILTRVFNDVGLPDAIRSDNGSPFGSIGAGGLSRLSVWFLKLGIEVRHIPPSSPQDNGRHERMHRTLKAETARPPADRWEQQQVRFNRFRRHYNEERPHEALGQTVPASRWSPPWRTMPAAIKEPWYDPDHEVRRVRRTGEIKWRGEHIFIGEALAREPVGLAEIDLGLHIVRFCGRDLGLIDRAGRFHRFAPPRARLRKAPEPAME
jgi:transposase InsO family protein